MNNKTIIGIVVAAIAAYFLFFRKKKEETKTEEQIIKEAQANTNVKYAQSIEANVEVVEVDKETEEYNNAINKYKRLSNGYAPPKGLTTKQILALCEDMEAKAEALAEYVKIAGKDDIQDEEMTLEQIQNEIETVRTEKINTVVTLINGIGTVSLASESAIKTARANYDILSDKLKSQVTNYSKLTAAESTLKSLQQQKAAADAEAALKAQQKATWATRKSEIESIVKAYANNLTDRGTSANKKPFDANVLNKLLAFEYRDKVYANQYFGTLGIKIAPHYTLAKSDYYVVHSITASLPSGNGMNRKNSEIAVKVRNTYKTITGTVNIYGEVVT